MFWNWAACEMNRITHSVSGPHGGPTMSSRALGLIQLAIHDAWFSTRQHRQWSSFLLPCADEDALPSKRYKHLPQRPTGADDPVAAMAGAAWCCLDNLYNPPKLDQEFPPSTVQALQAALARIYHLYVTGAALPLAVDELNAVPKLEPGARIMARAANGPSFDYGVAVAKRILLRLAVRVGEPGAGAEYAEQTYTPAPLTRFQFRDEPANPIVRVPECKTAEPGTEQSVAKRVYHGPFYGQTAIRFAVTVNHVLADPPKDTVRAQRDEYDAAVREVYHRGGAPTLNSTTRTPDQTVAALYWAYDGANLIGTPPRLYNQILRRVAWLQRNELPRTPIELTDEYVRLFALSNVAMADAGTLAWAEKYHHNFWRPLGGLREDDSGTGPQDSAPYRADGVNGTQHLIGSADPFWLALGAPSTNTNGVPFKPPFPAYPSGHATFGAAAFQMARLFYKQRHNAEYKAGGRVRDESPDDLAFDFVSDELDGISRDLYQKYDRNLPIQGQQGLVRTRVVRRFGSLWAAIYENAASRVYLGVHWRFDSFAAADVVSNRLGGDKLPQHKSPEDIRYKTNGGRHGAGVPVGFGGVPLGLAIANDIFKHGLQQSPDAIQPAAVFNAPWETGRCAITPATDAIQPAAVFNAPLVTNTSTVAKSATNTGATQVDGLLSVASDIRPS